MLRLLVATSLATVSFGSLRAAVFPIGIFGPLVTAIGLAAILCYLWNIIPPGGSGLGSVAFHTSIGIFTAGLGPRSISHYLSLGNWLSLAQFLI